MNRDTEITSRPKAKGVKISAICSCILLFLFFAPWLRGCGASYSGYELAQNDYRIDGAYLLYLIPIVAILIFINSATSQMSGVLSVSKLARVSWYNIGFVLVGILLLFSVFFQTLKKHGEFEWGFFGSIFSVLGILYGSITDITETRTIEKSLDTQ